MTDSLPRMITLILLSAIGSMSQAEQVEPSEAERIFTLEVLPTFKEKCAGCHGNDPKDIKGGFSILSLDHLLSGGESEGPSIVIGQPEKSFLVNAVKWQGSEMPPKETDRLTKSQIQSIERWIQMGAPWPSLDRQKMIRGLSNEEKNSVLGQFIETSGGLSDEWTNRRYQTADIWAFLPVKSSEFLTSNKIKTSEAIDALIDRKLTELGITPSQEASPEQLIRRATYDLTGLSPTFDEVQTFVREYTANQESTWRSLIDRLLDSPRYGEQWGRHWLDVTRYADTGGMSNDYERSNLWRYRDYVVRSFNVDKPYDQFIREQIAGDEMADQSVRRRLQASEKQVHAAQTNGDYDQRESEWIIATGFLRLGPWDNAMTPDEEARHLFLDDLVNITGQTFLSQTLRCVKCHDHKFDPIPTRDYYRLYSAFGTTQMAERSVPFLDTENLEEFEEGQNHVQRMLDFARDEKNKILAIQESAAKRWYEEHNLPYKDEKKRRNDPDEMKPPRHVGLDYVQQGQRKVREQDEWIWNRRLERYKPMAQSVYNNDSTVLAFDGARRLRINRQKQKGSTSTNKILIGGSLAAMGDTVMPGVLSALAVHSSTDPEAPHTLTDATEGRRMALADWIANEENPLTTRSIVNRIWQYHFGKGIAANSNNFGAKGGKPSHPELLDFLAAELVNSAWSIKSMHRLIMHTKAYRRSSKITDLESHQLLDPNDQFLSHFPRKRLSAEELRDTILQSTGEMVHELGGLPVMPEINMEVALQPRMIQFSIAPAYQPSPTPKLRNRRSIYAYQIRGQADPFTELFNQPNPNESCEQRETAAVTPQVFTLLNSDMMMDRSIAMAKKIKLATDPQQGAIKHEVIAAFRAILKRNPSTIEQKQISNYLSETINYHQSRDPEPVTYPTEITRSLVEELSGRVFEYSEILPIFETYHPDQKATDVSPETRALADVCLLLFNTNEFLYVE